MAIIAGMAGYDFDEHDSATSSGEGDEQQLIAPTDRYGTIVSVESAPVRVTFDGERATPEHGILLPPGVHFLPFARDIRFASTSEESAAVSIVWLKGIVSTKTAD